MKNILRSYWHSQRGSAIKKRNIPWQLTFEEWLDIWEKSGHLQNRGRGKGKYCMARYNDSGPYAVGNVYITLNEQNNKEQHIFNPTPSAKRVQTPLGIFESQREAAKAHGVIAQTIRHRLKILPDQYKRL